MEVKSIVNFLGGKKTFKRDVARVEDLMKAVKEGFPFNAVTAVSKRLAVSEKALLGLIAPSRRTAARRVRHHVRLREVESDKLVRVIRVANMAESIFGSMEKANKWLGTALRALDGKAPLALLNSDLGSRQVEEVLVRIDEGIVS